MPEPQTDADARVRAIFLDIGDTVMRPNPSWEHVYAMAFAEFGVEISAEDLQGALRHAYRHGGWGFDSGFEPTEETSFRRTVEIDQAAITELGLGPMPDAFFRRLGELFMVTSHWHVFPDVLPTLLALKQRGLIIGAVSNWVWNLPELLHSLELISQFDFVSASARVGFEKPHPRIFNDALSRAGVKPGEAIHVGDHLDADVGGAQRLGIGAILMDRYGRHQPDQLPAGLPVIRSLDELVPIVDAHLAAGVGR